MAYVLDIRSFSDEIFKMLKGVEVLILSALRYEPSPSHFSIEEALAFAKRSG
jgi:phosphoribosyl 1,2-cyclic phosphate phosphodiesterase